MTTNTEATKQLIKELTTGKKRFGLWHVYTYAGEEGERYVDLGIHLGNFDDITFNMGKHTWDKLYIRPVQVKTEHPLLADSVHVDSSDHDFNSLVFTSVKTSVGCFFKSTRLDAPESVKKEVARNNALAKLSKEDRIALGL